MPNTNYKEVMSQYKFVKDYAKWNYEADRYETWDESVQNVMQMHKTKYSDKLEQSPELLELMNYAEQAYKDKFCLGSQRALQFAGEPTIRKNERMYNCLTSYCDRVQFFQEAIHWLLCGGGVGFSVQPHHVNQLPDMVQRSDEAITYTIADSIEGWADAFGVLISSYCSEDATFPEYQGKKVFFDYSEIRPEGAKISGGFKAPGPNGLRESIQKVETILHNATADGSRKLKPIECYDIIMHMSDAVLSGGIRRSATICIFSPDDEEMLTAKTGNWFVDNPQRGRSNNSALLVRGKTKKETFEKLFKSVQEVGEPGIVWAESTEVLYNPCVSGDTMIELENGEYMSIKNLTHHINEHNEPVFVKSFNTETKQNEFKEAYIGLQTKQNVELIELELENGSKIKLTPDHKVYTLNRGYIQAKDLTTEDDLVESEFDPETYIESPENTINNYIDTSKWTNLAFSQE